MDTKRLIRNSKKKFIDPSKISPADLEKKDDKYGNGATYSGQYVKFEMYQELVRWGQGTLRWTDGSSYEGTWQNDVPHGEGVFELKSSNILISKYSGKCENGMAQGKGTFQIPLASEEIEQNGGKDYKYKYTGMWHENKMHGDNAVEELKCTTYEGSFREGKRSGYGKLKQNNENNDLVYDGEWSEGKMEG